MFKVTLVLLLAVGAYCHEGEDHGYASVVEAAVGADILSTLVEAVTAAELVDMLSDPELNVTVFAPTNEAFDAALSALGMTLAELASDAQTLMDLLTYHVVDMKAMAADLEDGMELFTLSGESLMVNITDKVIIEAEGSSAEVIVTDILAGMSVVHVIDTVLLPFML
eukprot:TRINITY_DN838_c0_g1_i1.p1 TRINITY_DN838_c0_g1~~TRINITY_DN838_c0_g1_i1.p1  ORF type:complete len:167 (-),score=35.13 TRINITY_DN838_c0_g1_i1:217-717(-)